MNLNSLRLDFRRRKNNCLTLTNSPTKPTGQLFLRVIIFCSGVEVPFRTLYILFCLCEFVLFCLLRCIGNCVLLFNVMRVRLTLANKSNQCLNCRGEGGWTPSNCFLNRSTHCQIMCWGVSYILCTCNVNRLSRSVGLLGRHSDPYYCQI